MNCFKPIHITDPRDESRQISVPCGRCAACLKNKSADWVTRLKIETFYATSAYFCTLTYAEPYLPHTRSGIPCFSSRDITLFFKRLRNCVPDKLRYFLVCEYGKENQRPHYHFILWNWPPEVDLLTCIHKCWVTSEKNPRPMMMPDENGTVRPCTEERITYVCKYIQKKQDVPKHFMRPFMRCSTRPGIGSQILDKPEWVEFYRNTPSGQVFIQGEQRYLPRYLKDKLYNTPELKMLLNESKARYVNTKNDKERKYLQRSQGYSIRSTHKVVERVDKYTGEIFTEVIQSRPQVDGDFTGRDIRAQRMRNFISKYKAKKRQSYKF